MTEKEPFKVGEKVAFTYLDKIYVDEIMTAFLLSANEINSGKRAYPEIQLGDPCYKIGPDPDHGTRPYFDILGRVNPQDSYKNGDAVTFKDPAGWRIGSILAAEAFVAPKDTPALILPGDPDKTVLLPGEKIYVIGNVNQSLRAATILVPESGIGGKFERNKSYTGTVPSNMALFGVLDPR